jgi:hypothetical protein
MDKDTIKELLDNPERVQTIQVKFSAEELLEVKAAMAVRGLSASTHLRTMAREFADKVKIEKPAAFLDALDKTRRKFIKKKDALAKAHDVRFISPKKKKAEE